MNRRDIEGLLNSSPELREKLYARGYLLTSAKIADDMYPFYGQWEKDRVFDAVLYTSPEQRKYVHQETDVAVLLVGHAYNPFSMESIENSILADLCASLKESRDVFFERLNQLTGVFTLFIITTDQVMAVGDATGMQTTFYTHDKGAYYISSHEKLIGDLLCLVRSNYVERLSKYKFFPLLGNSLPGDLTQYDSVKRLIPNHAVYFEKGEWRNERFYWPASKQISKEEIVDSCSGILSRNMELISQKWKKPAISMTGGCDSKTTLACANGLYDKFTCFSYCSSEAEQVDASAAKEICNSCQIPHHTYVIPDNDEAVKDVECVRMLLNWNTGDLRKNNKNDVRKRAYFVDCKDFDVEVKSWASEVGRAYYSKRFNGRKKFGHSPTPRACTTLYKFFLHDRGLVKETDLVFADYLKRYFLRSTTNPIEWQEQFFWEFRVPAWNGLVITGEHRYSYDITIPYNNRKLLELLLSASLEDRINDNIYQEIRTKMNPKIDEIGISVVNLKHTKMRARMENIYFSIHTHIPF